ncbi:MAG TPA: hypothetical protein ENJ57_05805 [Rhizobiales bacterium]|nr:hypothetical protein [Hyphomicrobiales bacterium]
MMEVAGMVLDAVVACLLVATIVYCMVLDRRIRSFKAEQKLLTGLVGDLNSATRNAEEAVAGLKVTSQVTQGELGGKLDKARSLSDELAFMVETGSNIASRLSNPAARAEPVQQRQGRSEPGDNVAVLNPRKPRREKVEPAFTRPVSRPGPQSVMNEAEEAPVSLQQVLQNAR